MNPGLISHFAKKGILDAAEYFLRNKNDKGWSDLDFNLIEKYLKEKNYPKLAQAINYILFFVLKLTHNTARINL